MVFVLKEVAFSQPATTHGPGEFPELLFFRGKAVKVGPSKVSARSKGSHGKYSPSPARSSTVPPDSRGRFKSRLPWRTMSMR